MANWRAEPYETIIIPLKSTVWAKQTLSVDALRPEDYSLWHLPAIRNKAERLSTFYSSLCSTSPLRPHDCLLEWREGRGGHVHWKTKDFSILKYYSAIPTFGLVKKLSWDELPKTAIEAQLLAPTKAAFDY